ncbi:centrosomal protein 43 isoform X3 [Suncus etruscus]|uniref:centrosomal protein 43 isoform X3 n=1 Tax=Suncus etruscus TaxID=109475 RepID=UPI00210F3146|nr:centrosomal protein 43 isoform X3 [Suncus etruscus]
MAATAAAVAVAAEEDTELRDLLVQTLENSGVLNRIKAELRAAVFLALEEQEKVENKTPLVNESLKKFLNTKDGRLVASLVAEFLQFFNLDFTLAVFQPETSTLQGLDARENLARDLGIIEAEGTVGGPLLLEVLRRCQQKEKGFICREGALMLSEVPSPPKSPDGKAGTHSSTSKTSTEASDTSISSSDSRSRSSRHMSSPESRAGTLLSRTSVGHNSVGPGADAEPDGDSFFDDPVLEPQSACGWIREPGKHAGSLASLTDAPLLKSGLSSLAGAPSLKDPEGQRGRTVLKDPRVASEDAGTHGPGAGEDDYADDFNSSHRSERSELSIGEEIEEDLSVGVDELNASDKLDELTQDLSVSQLSDVADYLEDVA